MKKKLAYDIICKEYIDKCKQLGGCDSCIAEIWCITNDQRLGEVPNRYCYSKLKQYFRDRED